MVMPCSLGCTVVLDLAEHDMDCGKVEIEHPTQPECGIVGGLLLVIVMPDAKVIRNIEQVAVIGRGK